jgi:Ca2+-binding EF-hand superfamily protein
MDMNKVHPMEESDKNDSRSHEGSKQKDEAANNEFEKELLEAFNEFDEDKSGTISKQEFGNFMRKLGYHPTLVELQEMIDEVDKDKQGNIGFEEFKMIMTKTIRDEFTQNSSIEAFAVFDKSKSGKIRRENLQNILMTKGDQNMEENEIMELMKHIPFDDNDEINYRDFVKNTFDLFK